MKDLDTAVNEIVCDGVTTQMKATEQYMLFLWYCLSCCVSNSEFLD